MPVYPTGHWQVYASPDADATHTPPCWQGLDAHALTHLMPVDAWMAKKRVNWALTRPCPHVSVVDLTHASVALA